MNRSEPSDDTPEISADIDKETTNDSAVDVSSSPASSESEVVAITPNDQPRGKKITWNMVLREVLFILALALTTYDALQNSPPKISRTPTALPLFGKGSLVSDWYKGQLSAALTRISTSEVSFVMYYAPWDAETQYVSKEFEKAALIMFKQVHFSAVNCWQPGGECRLQHNKISVWPIIMVYTVHLKSVVYTGPKDTMSMVKFLRNVMKPIHRISNHSDLMSLVAVCDAVTVGFELLSNEKKSTNYNKLYNVALRSLEFDPFGDVCFAVVTSPMLANQLGVDDFPNLKLMLWNETLEYPSDLEFNDDSIISWVWENIHKKSSWRTPQWQKSFAMQKIFAAGPVMVLFTPRNLYNDRNPSYDLLHEVALEYHTCDNPQVQKLTKYMALQRRIYISNEFKVKQSCVDWRKDFTDQEKVAVVTVSVPKIMNNAGKSKWLNKTVQKNKFNDQKLNSFWFMDSEHLYSDGDAEVVGMSKCAMQPLQDSCPSVQDHVADIRNVPGPSNNPPDTMTKSTFSYETSMLSQDEPRSSVKLTKRKMKEECILRELARDYHPPAYPLLAEKEMRSVEGLSCETNRSLSFLAMDSLSSHHFAESLGIDILNIKDHTAVIILDNQRESQYLLGEPYGEVSLRNFVYNFTMDYLIRDLRTVLPTTKYTHYFGSGIVNEMSESGVDFRDIHKYVNPLCQPGNLSSENVCIHELSTSNFQNFIMQPNKGVLVAMCSGGTGACGGLLSLALLAVNRILGTPGLVSVGRIDSTKHDLPWQHTVPKYPSLIFYPMSRKADYFAYPENQPITIEGLLAFILSGMEAPLKLYAQVLLCNQTQAADAMSECLRNVRGDTISLIGNTLKQLRRFNKPFVRSLLLKRLEYLRNVYISLVALNTTKLPVNHPILSTFRDSIQCLIQVWGPNSLTPNNGLFGPLNKSIEHL